MSLVTQHRVINLKPGVSAPLVVHCSYGDTGKTIEFTVINGDSEYSIPSGASVAVKGIRQDGGAWGPYVCTVSGSTVSFDLTSAMTSVAGGGIAEVSITSGSQVIGTANFCLLVEEATFPNGVSYENDPSVYQAILNYVHERFKNDIPGVVTAWLASHISNPSNPPIDTSLTVSGAAADAETVGDELFASLSLKYSNYEELVEVTNLNLVAGTPGNYWISYDKAQTLTNMPVAHAGRLFVLPAKGSGSTDDGGIQLFVSSQNNGEAEVWFRGWKSNTWSAWMKAATDAEITDLKNAMTAYNAYNLLDESLKNKKVNNGVTWERLPGYKFSVSASSVTSTSLFDLYNAKVTDAGFPEWLEPGKSYKVKYSSENVDFRVLCRQTASDSSSTNILSTKQDAVLTMPDPLYSVIIRLAVSGGTTNVNEVVTPVIMSAATNEELDTAIQEMEPAVEASKNSIEALSRLNAFLPYYASFVAGIVDVNTPGELSISGTTSATRRTAILTADKDIYVSMMNSKYVFRLYWWDEELTLHSTAWGRFWKIPTDTEVALTIKMADSSSFADNEQPQYALTAYDKTPKDYYLSEINSVVERVKAANTEPGLCFLLSTDQHTMGVQGTLVKHDTISDMVSNMIAVSEKIHFDGHISLGDIADYKVGSAENFAAYGITDNTDYPGLDAIFYDWMDSAMDKLASVHPNFIYILGNHDDNRYINKDVLHADVSAYDYTPGEMYSYYTQRSQFRRVPNVDNHGLDYYIDYPEFKIRMFCLDSNHYYSGDESSPHGYLNCWWYGFQDSTVIWMREQLAAIPAGWSVLVLTHMSAIKENNADNVAYRNMAEMKSVIQNYINNGGSYIATFYGHSHCDWSATTPWLEISFDCQKCYNSSPSYPNMPGATHATRTQGTASEDCWNIVIVQPNSRKIKVIRFGAGNDREFSY